MRIPRCSVTDRGFIKGLDISGLETTHGADYKAIWDVSGITVRRSVSSGSIHLACYGSLILMRGTGERSI